MKIICIIFLFYFTSIANASNPIANIVQLLDQLLDPKLVAVSDGIDPDISIDDFVKENGYTLETHDDLITEDGYYLTLHRILSGGNNQSTLRSDGSPKPVVLLRSGLGGSSMDYLYLGAGKSLPMLLVDEEYDAWLLNTRGNRFTKGHVTYPSYSNSSQFWNFTYHEKGIYDLPTAIDYILNNTGVENVTYIGLSEGTIEGIVTTVIRPEYQEKINVLILFSPVPYISHTKVAVTQLLVKHLALFKNVTELLHYYGMPYSHLMGTIGKLYCSDESAFQSECVQFIGDNFGPDDKELNKTLLPLIFSNLPSGGSIKELLHFGQNIQTKKFQQYDYGATENLIYYNNSTPPEYDLSKMKLPVAVYYGKNDYVAIPDDVKIFLTQVPNLVVEKLIDYEFFNHLDFAIANDVKTLLYNDVFELIKKHNP